MKSWQFRRLWTLMPACLVLSLSWAAVRAVDRSERLNGPLDHQYVNGDVLSFKVSEDGRWVLYRAHQDEPTPGLYAVRSDRSQGPVRLSQPGAAVGDFQLGPNGPPFVFIEGNDLVRVRTDGVRVQLNPPLVSGGSVTDFRLASNGLRVVYRADQEVDEAFQLHSVWIDGTHPVLLSSASVAGGDVTSFRLSTGGTLAVFQGNTLDAARSELFRVPVNGSAPPQPLCGPFVTGGDVSPHFDSAPTYAFGPRDRHVLYLADQLVNGRVELFSVPLDSSSAPVRLNAALIAVGDVRSFHVSKHERVVYRADQALDEVIELYSAPIDGSLPAVKLNGTERAVRSCLVSPQDARVAFVASPSGNGREQVYSAPLDGSLAAVQLSQNPTTGSPVPMGAYTIAPGSGDVVHVGQPAIGGPTGLFRVPIDGSSAPVALSGAGGAVSAFQLTPDGSRFVYQVHVSEDEHEFRAGPIDGSSPPLFLHPPFAPGTRTESDFVVRDGFVAYRNDTLLLETIELHTVPLDGSQPPLLLNDPLWSTPAVLDALSFTLSPDDDWAVYATNAGVFSVPLTDPSAVRMLSLPGPVSYSYTDLRVTPDSGRVAFRGPRVGMHAFSAPIDGSAACLQLSYGAFALPFGASSYRLSPDGGHLVYGTSTYFFSSSLIVVPMDGSQPPLGLAGNSRMIAYTPDGSRIVSVTFNNPKNPLPDSSRLFVRAADGSSPALELAPSTPYGLFLGIQHAQLAPDGATVVYTCDQEELGKFELYSVPVDGPPPTKLSGVLESDRDVTNGVHLTPDGTRVVYAADRDEAQAFELYVAPLDGGLPPIELSGPMVAGGDVALLSASSGPPLVQIAPDSSRLLYVADQEVDERYELYVVPLDASLPPAKVNAPLVAGGDVSLDPAGVRISPDGTRALYLADQQENDRIALYSAPIEGGGPVVALSGTMVSGADVEPGFVFLPSSEAVVFRSDRAQNNVLELWLAPLDGASPPVRVSFLAHPAGDVLANFQVDSDGSHVFYLADAQTDEVVEFFRFPLRRVPHVAPR